MANFISPKSIENWVSKHFEFDKRSGKNGLELVIANPFYHNDKKKFNINLSKATCHDWRGDEWAGPVNPKTGKRNCSFIKFVCLYEKCTFSQALSILGSTYAPHVKTAVEAEKYDIKLPASATLISTSTDPQSRIALKWLASRGYTKDQVQMHQLYHLGLDVYWPYFEFDSLVYWQSRNSLNKRFEFPASTFEKDGKTYKSDASKGDFLYGFDFVEPSSYVIITEAIFDQHTLGDQALATGGAVLTHMQVEKLKILNPKKGVILSPDNDHAAIKSIISNYKLLSPLFPVYYSIPPELEYVDRDGDLDYTKDWNDLGRYICGFESVRGVHDHNIKKLDDSRLFQLVRLARSV